MMTSLTDRTPGAGRNRFRQLRDLTRRVIELTAPALGDARRRLGDRQRRHCQSQRGHDQDNECSSHIDILPVEQFNGSKVQRVQEFKVRGSIRSLKPGPADS
jgi:hypothetical protein